MGHPFKIICLDVKPPEDDHPEILTEVEGEVGPPFKYDSWSFVPAQFFFLRLVGVFWATHQEIPKEVQDPDYNWDSWQKLGLVENSRLIDKARARRKISRLRNLEEKNREPNERGRGLKKVRHGLSMNRGPFS